MNDSVKILACIRNTLAELDVAKEEANLNGDCKRRDQLQELLVIQQKGWNLLLEMNKLQLEKGVLLLSNLTSGSGYLMSCDIIMLL